MNLKSNTGLSLMEMIAVVGVLALLIVIVSSGFISFRGETGLDSAADNIVSLLSQARAKTLASEDLSQFGVYFESQKAVLFKGAGFNPLDSENQEFAVSSLAEISIISLNGGGSEIVFQRLTGKTDNYGTITLRLKNDSSKTKEIIIRPTGVISNE